MIKFYRGLRNSYDSTLHGSGIYFATDTFEIIHNGNSYSGLLSVGKSVENITLVDGVLTVTYTDKTTAPFTLTDLIPVAVAASEGNDGKSGLLSAADKALIDQVQAGINTGSTLLSSDQAATIAAVKRGDYENVVKTVSGNVLSLSESGDLSTVLSLSYDSATKHINLVGKDSANLGYVDATNFIKDGMLDDVEVVTIAKDDEGNIPEGTVEGEKYIKFVWNTDAGSKVDYVAVSDLAETYVAGDAISISDDNEIGVVIAANTSTETNYLKNSNGLMVSEMGANATKLKAEIQVQGGPLADKLTGVFANNVIPAGTSIEDILMKMISKEIFPELSTSKGSLSASMSLTTLAFDPTDTTVEVGTIVTTNALTANNSSCTQTPAKIKGMSHGYALTATGDAITNDGEKATTIEYALTDFTTASLAHSISFAYTGFTESVPTAATGTGSATMAATSLVVREGECKVSVTASGSKYTAKSPKVENETFWSISNIGTRQEESESIDSANLSVTASKTTSDKVTGVYKYFAGYYDFASNQKVEDVFTSDIIRGLTTHTGNLTVNGDTSVVGTTSVTSNGKSIVVAVPAKYKLSQFQNDLGGSELANFSITGTVAVKHPTNTSFTTDYTVYVWPVAGGATITYKNVKISKA